MLSLSAQLFLCHPVLTHKGPCCLNSYNQYRKLLLHLNARAFGVLSVHCKQTNFAKIQEKLLSTFTKAD